MNTLSLFPNLFGYEILGITLLRITVGFIFVYYGYLAFRRRNEKTIIGRITGKTHLWAEWIRIIIEIAGGTLLAIGLFTQGTALVLGIFTLAAIAVKLVVPKKFDSPFAFFVLLFVSLFTILVTGPGIWAFDLPL